MPRLFVISEGDAETQLEFRPGVTLMEVLRGRFPDELLALCGGACSCATCHVYVDDRFLSHLPAQGAVEDELLSMSDHRKPNSRLSCQIPLKEELDGLRVAIAPEA